jgi:hypothetical protein
MQKQVQIIQKSYGEQIVELWIEADFLILTTLFCHYKLMWVMSTMQKRINLEGNTHAQEINVSQYPV